MEFPELLVLAEIPVLAMMLCTEGDVLAEKLGKRHTVQALNRGIVYQMVLRARVTREVHALLRKKKEATVDSEDLKKKEGEKQEAEKANMDLTKAELTADGTKAESKALSEAVSAVLWACEEMAVHMVASRTTHLPMSEVRLIFLRGLREHCATTPPQPDSPAEVALADALLLSAPLRVGRLREARGTVGFSHLSLQEYFAAERLLAMPMSMAIAPCSRQLDLPALPAVQAFLRELYAHLSLRQQRDFILALHALVQVCLGATQKSPFRCFFLSLRARRVFGPTPPARPIGLQRTRGDVHRELSPAGALEELWGEEAAEGQRCRAAAKAMTMVAAVDHIVVGWDLSGCRFPGADLDGLQVLGHVMVASSSVPCVSLFSVCFTFCLFPLLP